MTDTPITPAALRELADDPQRYGPVADALHQAADAIETLTKERDRWQLGYKELSDGGIKPLMALIQSLEARLAKLREALFSIQTEYGTSNDKDVITTTARQALAADDKPCE